MQPLPTKPTDLAAMLSISIAYASHLLKGERPWTRPLSIAVYRFTGERVGPLVGATDEEIDVLEKFETGTLPPFPPSSSSTSARAKGASEPSAEAA